MGVTNYSRNTSCVQVSCLGSKSLKTTSCKMLNDIINALYRSWCVPQCKKQNYTSAEVKHILIDFYFRIKNLLKYKSTCKWFDFLPRLKISPIGIYHRLGGLIKIFYTGKMKSRNEAFLECARKTWTIMRMGVF